MAESDRPLCRWFKCLNGIPDNRKKYCCDQHGVADRQHRRRKLLSARKTIAALRPDDHALVEGVVDRESYRMALAEIARDARREDRRHDTQQVEIACRTATGWSRVPSPPFVQNDVQEVFLEEGRRRRRRDAASWLRFQSDSECEPLKTPSLNIPRRKRKPQRTVSARKRKVKRKQPKPAVAVKPSTATKEALGSATYGQYIDGQQSASGCTTETRVYARKARVEGEDSKVNVG
jgi:hypothetical protein